MNRSAQGKSPYAVRLRKQSPRAPIRSAKQPVQSLVPEVLLARPVKTRAAHRTTNSVGSRNVSFSKPSVFKPFKGLPITVDADSLPSRTEPKSVRHRGATPRVFRKTRITPKAGTYHRRALSLVDEYLDGYQKDSGETQIRTTDSEPSVVCGWSFATRTGVIPESPGKVNQDSYIAVPALLADRPVSLFGICDGHGLFGHKVSQFLKIRIPKLLQMDSGLLSSPVLSLANTIVRCNQEVLTGPVDVSLSGSTLNVVLIRRMELWCANVGDSRAVLGRKGNADGQWTAVNLSRDHKPDLEDEAERIINAGGRVACYQDSEGNFLGPARVWLKYENTPGLAMSRSIGDAVAASAGVIGIPEVLHATLTKEDKFLIVGSDGVFEFMDSDEVVQLVAPFSESGDAQAACKAVEKEAYARWAKDEDVVDDITCVVAFFRID